jgi:hypothetical protein
MKDEDEQKQLVCNVFSRPLNLIRRDLWTPGANQIFLKGANLTLKCIFGGLPTPEVI